MIPLVLLNMVLGTALCVFLVVFVSRRLTRDLAGLEERKLSALGKALDQVATWVTIVFAGWLLLWIIRAWPPAWVERLSQRKELQVRVQSVGGWTPIVQACAQVSREHQSDGYFYWWSPRGTNNPAPLPPALAGLKPRLVELWSHPKGPVSIRIQVFGMHSTGGHSEPYFALEVLCGETPPGFDPTALVSPDSQLRVHAGPVAGKVFEVY